MAKSLSLVYCAPLSNYSILFAGFQVSRFFLICFVSLLWVSGSFATDHDVWHQSSTYEIEYIVDLEELPKDKTINLWVPLPARNMYQAVLSSRLASLQPGWTRRDVIDNRGNDIAQFFLPVHPGRSDSLHFTYIIERHPSNGTPAELSKGYDDPAQFLSPAKKIPLDGLIGSIAEEQRRKFGPTQNLLRSFYDYVYDSMTYSKEGEGWGQGDAIWACQSNYGNCTDFHSLYIGLVRSQHIPARFKIGFPLPAFESSGRHDGYHCWAEVYEAASGWLPLDASEAKKSGKRDEYFGKIPSDRIEFTQGRDIVLSDLQRGDPLNYFVYPYAETPEQIISRLPTKLLYRRITSDDSSLGSE